MLKKPINITGFVCKSAIKPVLQCVQVTRDGENFVHTATDSYSLVTITYKPTSHVTVPAGLYDVKGSISTINEQYPEWKRVLERFNESEITSGITLKYDLEKLSKLLSFFGKLVPPNKMRLSPVIVECQKNKILRVTYENEDFSVTGLLMGLSE